MVYPGTPLPSGRHGYQKLLPPLVHNLRLKVKEWREKDYEGAKTTVLALLNWWFGREHLIPKADGSVFNFRYYLAI